ncbi:MAG TPA: hypothetical protein VKI44_07735 [Acetobacteraceae bacterium]|nr:hypothetical protein [Acetobacteraceae bacterium]
MTYIGSVPILLALRPRTTRAETKIEGTKRPLAIDPLFGLSFSPDEVKFEPATPDLIASCPDITNKGWTRRSWVFAQAEAPDGTASQSNGIYVIVGGFFVARSSDVFVPPEAVTFEDRKWLVDRTGALLHRTGTHCDLIGPPLEEFQAGSAADVDRKTLQALADDAVRRYIAAFGGPTRLGEAILGNPEFARARLLDSDLLITALKKEVFVTLLVLDPKLEEEMRNKLQ